MIHTGVLSWEHFYTYHLLIFTGNITGIQKSVIGKINNAAIGYLVGGNIFYYWEGLFVDIKIFIFKEKNLAGILWIKVRVLCSRQKGKRSNAWNRQKWLQ